MTKPSPECEFNRFTTLYELLKAITELTENIENLEPMPDDLVRIASLFQYGVRKHISEVSSRSLAAQKKQRDTAF